MRLPYSSIYTITSTSSRKGFRLFIPASNLYQVDLKILMMDLRLNLHQKELLIKPLVYLRKRRTHLHFTTAEKPDAISSPTLPLLPPLS